MRVDGVLKPGGPTETAINEEAQKQAGGNEIAKAVHQRRMKSQNPPEDPKTEILRQRFEEKKREKEEERKKLPRLEHDADEFSNLSPDEPGIFGPPGPRSDEVDHDKAGEILVGVIKGERDLPKVSLSRDGKFVVNIGGYHLTPKFASLLQQTLRARTPKEIDTVRRKIAAEGPRSMKNFKPIGERGNSRPNPRPFQVDLEKLGDKVVGSLIIVPSLRESGKGLETLLPKELRDKAEFVLKALDWRNLKSRVQGGMIFGLRTGRRR